VRIRRAKNWRNASPLAFFSRLFDEAGNPPEASQSGLHCCILSVVSWDRRAHQEIQGELWDEIQRTKAKYQDLNREYSRMLNETRDIGLDHSDGTLAFAQSLKKHRELQSAIEELRLALKRFNDHII